MRALFLLLSLSFALTSRAEVLQNPYFFEIQKDGQISYLFGTQHFGFTLNDVPDFIFKALDSKPIFMGESDVRDEMSNSDKPESDASGPPLDDFAIEQLKKRGVSENWIKRVNDYPKMACFVYINFESLLILPPLDERLYRYAKWSRKFLLDLDDDSIKETVQKVFDACDFNKMAHEMTPERARQSRLESIEEYRRGDPSFLAPNFADHEQRNKKWLPKILKAHRRGGAFITFGNGHLSGPQGLLAELFKAGFKIRRIIRAEDL